MQYHPFISSFAKDDGWRDEGTFEPSTELLSREAGPIPCPRTSCEFTLLDSVFWYYVTELIYIGSFDILLLERHTEIEHISRLVLFLDCTQHKVVIPFWCFGITNWSHFLDSRWPKRTRLDSRQIAHTDYLQQKAPLNGLTVKMKAIQSLERYLPDDKMSYSRKPKYSIKFDVQLFSSFSFHSLLWMF
jgi:hypothetical protein